MAIKNEIYTKKNELSEKSDERWPKRCKPVLEDAEE
jgi:hypothetical protein